MPQTIRVLAASLTLIAAAACGTGDGGSILALAPPPPAPGQPAGTVMLPAGADLPAAVKKVQAAITASGGTVTAVVDHAANARAAGAQIPAATLVVGGTATAQLPLVRANQRAGANLPQRYLLRQDASGAVTLIYNGPDFIAAASGVLDAAAVGPLADQTTAVVDRATGAPGTHTATALIGVTPTGFLKVVPAKGTVPAIADRLRAVAARAPDKVVAALDMAAGSPAGTAPRPTIAVLVSVPTLEAPLLAAAPTLGLELPLRFLVWLDETGTTQVGVTDVTRLAVRHGIRADDPAVLKLASESDRILKTTAGIAV